MRHARLAALACAALVIVDAHPVAARTIIPGTGGRGDRYDEDRCPDRQVVIGLAGKSGDWIDSLQILCAPLQEGGRTGKPAFRSPLRGGGGGAPAEEGCPFGETAHGVHVAYADEDSKVVLLVSLRCTSPQADAGLVGHGLISLDRPQDMTCQQGEYVVGLNINSGRHVNNIGMVCDRVEPAKVVRGNATGASAPSKPRTEVAGNATGQSAAGAMKIGQFDLPFESESSLGGKFDFKLQVVGMYRNPARAHVTGTLVNTDIGPQYNGTFDGTMPMDDPRTVTLTYEQPAANARGTVVFHFSADGETFTGDGMHMGTTPFQWTGRRKHAN